MSLPAPTNRIQSANVSEFKYDIYFTFGSCVVDKDDETNGIDTDVFMNNREALAFMTNIFYKVIESNYNLGMPILDALTIQSGEALYENDDIKLSHFKYCTRAQISISNLYESQEFLYALCQKITSVLRLNSTRIEAFYGCRLALLSNLVTPAFKALKIKNIEWPDDLESFVFDPSELDKFGDMGVTLDSLNVINNGYANGHNHLVKMADKTPDPVDVFEALPSLLKKELLLIPKENVPDLKLNNLPDSVIGACNARINEINYKCYLIYAELIKQLPDAFDDKYKDPDYYPTSVDEMTDIYNTITSRIGDFDMTDKLLTPLRQNYTKTLNKSIETHSELITVFRNIIYENHDKIKNANVTVQDKLEMVTGFISIYEAGDQGYSELAYDHIKDDVKIVQYKPFKAYEWREDSKIWRLTPDSSFVVSMINERAGKYVRETGKKHLEFLNTPDPDRGERMTKVYERLATQIQKFILYINTANTHQKAFTLVKSKLFHEDFDEGLNSIPYYYPTKSCEMLDLRDGQIYPRTREHAFSFNLDCDLDNDPEGLDFVDKLIYQFYGGDKELIAFDFLNGGYTLTGETSEKSFVMYYGPNGNNGKTKKQMVFEKLLGTGKFHAVVNQSVIVAPRMGSEDKLTSVATTGLNAIMGRRYINSSETAKGQALHERNVKGITGMDKMNLRGLYKEEGKSRQCFAKLDLSSNHVIELDPSSDSVLNRAIQIPCNTLYVTQEKYDAINGDDDGKGHIKGKSLFVIDNKIDELVDKYLGCFLTYYTRGAVEYYKLINAGGSIPRPTASARSLKETMFLTDKVNEFIGECLNDEYYEDETETDHDGTDVRRINHSTLWKGYKTFMKTNHSKDTPLNSKEFKAHIVNHYPILKFVHPKQGPEYYLGYRFNVEHDPQNNTRAYANM